MLLSLKIASLKRSDIFILDGMLYVYHRSCIIHLEFVQRYIEYCVCTPLISATTSDVTANVILLRFDTVVQVEVHSHLAMI